MDRRIVWGLTLLGTLVAAGLAWVLGPVSAGTEPRRNRSEPRSIAPPREATGDVELPVRDALVGSSPPTHVVEVRSESGQPILGLVAELRTEVGMPFQDAVASRKADRGTAWELRVARWPPGAVLWVSALGHREERIERPPVDRRLTVELSVLAIGSLRGWVVGGGLSTEAIVRAIPSHGGPSAGWTARSDGAGWFRIDGIEPGIPLWLTAESASARASVPVAPLDEGEHRDGVRIELTTARSVSVLVTERESAAPIADVSLVARGIGPSDGWWNPAEIARATTDLGGRATLLLPAAGAVVTATSVSHGQGLGVVDPGAQELRIEMAGRRPLRFDLVPLDGSLECDSTPAAGLVRGRLHLAMGALAQPGRGLRFRRVEDREDGAVPPESEAPVVWGEYPSSGTTWVPTREGTRLIAQLGHRILGQAVVPPGARDVTIEVRGFCDRGGLALGIVDSAGAARSPTLLVHLNEQPPGVGAASGYLIAQPDEAGVLQFGSLAPGKWRVDVLLREATAHVPLESRTVTIAAGDVVDMGTLTLPSRGGMFLVCRSEDVTRPLEPCSVRVVHLASGLPIPDPTTGQDDTIGWTGHPVERDGLSVGSYRVEVRARGHVTERAFVEVEEHEIEQVAAVLRVGVPVVVRGGQVDATCLLFEAGADEPFETLDLSAWRGEAIVMAPPASLEVRIEQGDVIRWVATVDPSASETIELPREL